ncbi:MAG TPA: PKD domain-containing protein [Chthoniobacteraceae bacterium]|nr:PKD domain-containing protein [Chthoniobacteraceae bacterium]
MENHIRFQRTPILILLASAMGLASPQTLEAQEHNHKGELFPVLSLPVGARGADVPRILGKDKHRVAAWYGHTDEEFDALCFRDRKSLRSDRKGHLHYFCEALPAAGDTPPPAFGPYPYAQTFSLHSRPTATRVIYLDFTGHTTSGTVWNSSFAGGASVVTPPYDTDGNPSAFSTAEMDSIQHIWMRVSEDYAPFDVDVTTADPGIEGLRKTSTTDNAYGVRACIGGSGTDWYGAQAGGVAYVGSFGWSDGTPAFIFSVALGNGYEKYVAEAVSHEVGHTLGLHHDGVIGGSAYFQGQNNWAPIMGVGYYADLVQFSKGEYSGANNKEDDLAIIQSYISYQPDDYGQDILHATTLSGTNPSTFGIIGKTGDSDIFGFSTGAGNISFTIALAPFSPNLATRLSLYDGAGSLLVSDNPEGLSATLATTVSAGTYYVVVKGVGGGNPLTTYSDYGSLGQYHLVGTTVPIAGQPPVAVVTTSTPNGGTAPMEVAFSGLNSYDPDGTIAAYDWDFDDGTTSSLPNPTHVYANAGTYAPSLVVFDNTGLSSSAFTTITVGGNQVPLAQIAATLTTGTAPLAINFSSNGSRDPDGTIAGYAWNFGDGSSSIEANPAKTYASAGTYTATLIVTDNLGATASASVVITATSSNVVTNVAYSSSVAMSKSVSSKGMKVIATITARDLATGIALRSPTIYGYWEWTGKTTAPTIVHARADSAGQKKFTAPTFKSTYVGTVTFKVTNIVAAGYSFSSSAGVTQGSIFLP